MHIEDDPEARGMTSPPSGATNPIVGNTRGNVRACFVSRSGIVMSAPLTSRRDGVMHHASRTGLYLTGFRSILTGTARNHECIASQKLQCSIPNSIGGRGKGNVLIHLVLLALISHFLYNNRKIKPKS